MTTPADVLWRINNEYRKRLEHAKTYLNLLEQLVLMQHQDQHVLAALNQALNQVEQMIAEHRQWRYHYYYESTDSQRMVQTHGAINQALAQFSHIRSSHEQELQNIRVLLYHLQRPDPAVTTVPIGDLWQLSEFALQDLSGFDDYLRSISQV
jgi:hypothetical protein